MTIFQHLQKKEQRRRALLGAQFNSLKAYRGVPYEHVTNGKPVHAQLTYRGSSYLRKDSVCSR